MLTGKIDLEIRIEGVGHCYGDLTALDPYLVNDFGEMLELGLVGRIDDEMMFTYFRLNGELNVHAEYGYFVNEKTAHTIVEWWRGHSLSSGD